MVDRLEIENRSLQEKFGKSACDAAKFEAMSKEKDTLISEHKHIAKTWHDLAETLRTDTFAMFKSWR